MTKAVDFNPPALTSQEADLGAVPPEFGNYPRKVYTAARQAEFDRCRAALRERFKTRLFRGPPDVKGKRNLLRVKEGRDGVVNVAVVAENHDVASLLEAAVGGPQKGRSSWPPGWLATALRSEPDPALPTVVAASHIPTLRPDGTLATTPGFDVASGAYYAPRGPAVAVPDVPTKADVDAAARLLCGFLDEIGFERDRDRVAAVAVIVEAVLRPVLKMPRPIFVVEPTVRGDHKELLPALLGVIVDGAHREFEWTRTEAEVARSIAEATRAGAGYRWWQFHNGRAGHEALVAAASETVHRPSIVVSLKSGAAPHETLVPWSVPIRLDWARSNSGTRTGKRGLHRDQAVKYRFAFIRAAAILVRHWAIVGRRELPSLPVEGPLRPWAATVGGVLAAAGIPGADRLLVPPVGPKAPQARRRRSRSRSRDRRR